MVFICDICEEEFRTMFDLKKHVSDVHEHSHFETLGGETKENFKCKICKQIMKTRKNLLRHIREQHKEKMFHCLL